MKHVGKLFVALGSAIIVVVLGFFFIHLQDERKHGFLFVQKMADNKAEAIFDSIVLLRNWHAKYEYVYVKKQKSMDANPYLPKNTLQIDAKTTLLRVNPSWMTKQMAEMLSKRDNFFFHVTSLRPLNPTNTALNAFEKEALRYLEKYHDKKYYAHFDTKRQIKDYMMPLKTDRSCIGCHQQNKVGKLGGGIRISIPFKQYSTEIERIEEKFSNSISIALFVALMVLLLFLWIYKISSRNLFLNQKVQEAIETNKSKDKILQEQARSAQMGEMISMIAHQWRQPLNAISAASIKLNLLREMNEISDKDIEEAATFIQHETHEMSQIINDFMTFFKSDTQKSLFCLTETLEDTFKIIGAQLESRGIEFSFNVAKSCKIYGHKKELIHIFLNLIGNARDAFMQIRQPYKEIAIEAEKVDDQMVIRVKDNAGGIDEDIIFRIFDPYFTTKKQGQGTGIGLYMVKQMLESDFNGSIMVENIENGACFTIEIPFVHDEPSKELRDE